jgi:Zn-dependent protease with chaperone function
MKRGIRFRSLPNPPVGDVVELFTIDKAASILGVPVEYSAHHAGVADARGFWWNKRIVVGPAWLKLDPRTQRSILLHEVCHCKGFHMEQRALGMILLGIPAVLLPLPLVLALLAFGAIYFLLYRLGVQQELAADAFAAEQGYGVELLAWVKKMGPPLEPPTYYPPFEARCNKLEAKIKEKGDATA